MKDILKITNGQRESIYPYNSNLSGITHNNYFTNQNLNIMHKYYTLFHVQHCDRVLSKIQGFVCVYYLNIQFSYIFI